MGECGNERGAVGGSSSIVVEALEPLGSEASKVKLHVADVAGTIAFVSGEFGQEIVVSSKEVLDELRIGLVSTKERQVLGDTKAFLLLKVGVAASLGV